MAYLTHCADSVGKMELVAVLWVHFTYLFLGEGSPEPDCIGVWRRFHRRLETPPTISFQGRMEHVFCEIAIFQQNLGKR
ncbi:hypothetical protein DRQ11_09965 [candidate division KSB1 bacterium]|nr:MAG: hypothetical protein DRQ11_09965 [candidate division KSB1 bacterium]